MLLTQNGWWQNLMHNSITEAVEIKGLWNLQDTALQKWVLKNGASRSCFMSLGLRPEESCWCLNLCPVQHNSLFRFLLLPRRPDTVLFTSNALASCSNESDPLWTEEEGKPFGMASKEGQPWASLLTWSLHLYMFFAFVFPFWLQESSVISWPTSPLVLFPRVTQQRMSHPNSSQEQQCLGEWKCQRGIEDFCSANLNIKFLSKYSISTVGKHVGERERRNNKIVHR